MSDPKLGPSPAQIAMMGHNIQAQLGDRARRRRRRTRGLALGIGLGLLIGGSVTAAALAVRPAPAEQIRYVVDCYPAPAVSADFGRVLFLPEENDDVPFGSEFALMQCIRTYEREQIDAPNPTVCELADLRLGVFPNPEAIPREQFCVALGLHAPDY